MRSFPTLLTAALALLATSTSALPQKPDHRSLAEKAELDRRQFKGTRTSSAPRGFPSGNAVPGSTQQGLVGAFSGSSPRRRQGDTFVGYFDGQTSAVYADYHVLPHACDRVDDPDCPPYVFDFTMPASAEDVIEILYPVNPNAGFSAPAEGNLVLYASYPEQTLDPSTGNFVDSPPYLEAGSSKYASVELQHLGNAQHTAAGAPPIYNGAGWLESTVFTVDPTTGILGISWTNPDSTQATTYTVFSPSMALVYVTGDVDALATAQGLTDLEYISLVFNQGTGQAIST